MPFSSSSDRDSKRKTAWIFDLDGVLIHSMPVHVLAWERYISKLGLETRDVEQWMHGKCNSELVRDLLGNDLADDLVFEHGAAKERLFREMLLEGDLSRYRVPGLPEFLERHKDIPKAVGSNAEPANVDFVLDQLGLRNYFPVIVHGLEVDRPKPFPDIYLEAARRLKVDPTDCLVFEDSPTGVAAARAAEMAVVAVETTPAEFHDVDLQIDNFFDPKLEAWLEAQSATESHTK